MTDQQIPAGLTRDEAMSAREWATDYLKSGAGSERVRAAARALMALLPAPTLADMTREERAECRWMQADVKGRSVRYVIATPSDLNGLAGLVSADGQIEWTYPERVTPRPVLPRLEWPGDKKPALASALPDGWRLADHPNHGRVIVTNTIPNRAGDVCYVLPTVEDSMGYDWFFCDPDELTYLDQ